MAQAHFETLPTSGLHRLEPADRTLPADALKRVVEAAVSVVFSVDISRLQSGSRGRADVAQARQVAMYLAHCALSLSHTEIGRIFGRDRTTVAHACAIIEDRRDDPIFDRTIENMEEIVRRLAIVSGMRRES